MTAGHDLVNAQGQGSTGRAGATRTGYESAYTKHVALLQDPANFAGMVQRYNAPCLALFRDQGARMQYWLDKL
jgi:hypothetical protein